jgi:hypothetical protein
MACCQTVAGKDAPVRAAASPIREKRYGSSARRSASHMPWDHGRGGPGGGGEDEADGARRRRRSDFLGYYRVLGLQEAGA